MAPASVGFLLDYYVSPVAKGNSLELEEYFCDFLNYKNQMWMIDSRTLEGIGSPWVGID